MKNQKISVNKTYHFFHSPPLFCTAGSRGALWVQRNSPDFRAHTHLWAQTDLCLCRSSPLCELILHPNTWTIRWCFRCIWIHVTILSKNYSLNPDTALKEAKEWSALLINLSRYINIRCNAPLYTDTFSILSYVSIYERFLLNSNMSWVSSSCSFWFTRSNFTWKSRLSSSCFCGYKLRLK